MCEREINKRHRDSHKVDVPLPSCVFVREKKRDRKRERKGDEERQTNINKERENGRYVYKINVIKTLKNKLSILTDKKDLIYNIKNI